MRKNFFYKAALFSLVAAMTACTADDEVLGGVQTPEAGEETRPVVMTALDFIIDQPSTRVDLTVDLPNNVVRFNWADADQVGIFPESNHQIPFKVPAAEGAEASNTTTFDGGAWALRANAAYSAYYPFASDITLDKTAIKVDYANQTQNGNASTAHISAVDYMAAQASTPENGNVNFEFAHLGSLMILQLTMPEAKTFNQIELTSDQACFTQEGTFDLTQAAPESVPAIVSTKSVKKLTYGLTSVSTTESDKTLHLYLMAAPTDLTGKNAKVVLRAKDGTSYEAALAEKNMVAGHAYLFPAEMVKVDLGFDPTDSSKYKVAKTIIEEHNTHDRASGDRKVKSIKIQGDGVGTTNNIVSLTNDEMTKVIVDMTSDPNRRLKVQKGTSMQVQLVQQTMLIWTHVYVYIDEDKNGFTAGVESNNWKPTGDLRSFTAYDHTNTETWLNSLGKEPQPAQDNNPASTAPTSPTPSFTAPAKAGEYRMRVKTDWNSIDPMGRIDGNNIWSNGGYIVDIILEVTE